MRMEERSMDFVSGNELGLVSSTERQKEILYNGVPCVSQWVKSLCL